MASGPDLLRAGLPAVRCYSCGRNYLARRNGAGYCCARMALTHPPQAPGGPWAGARAPLLTSAKGKPPSKPAPQTPSALQSDDAMDEGVGAIIIADAGIDGAAAAAGAEGGKYDDDDPAPPIGV
jgi:hypothetical protein